MYEHFLNISAQLNPDECCIRFKTHFVRLETISFDRGFCLQVTGVSNHYSLSKELIINV